jgi:hypothetical protein
MTKIFYLIVYTKQKYIVRNYNDNVLCVMIVNVCKAEPNMSMSYNEIITHDIFNIH